MAYSAMETKFLPATSYKGARIKVTARNARPDGSRDVMTVTYEACSPEGRGSIFPVLYHLEAAKLLLPHICNNPDGVHLEVGATDKGFIFVIVQNS